MTKEKKAFKKLVSLGSKGDTAPYSYSPNDVLVQIALPLILILAIATRLMMVAQAMSSNNNEGQIILDLWKQQFILRIDRVLEDWEEHSRLTAFPEFSRVQWNAGWPSDESFKTLCSEGSALGSIDTFKMDIYRDVLTFRPDAGTEGGDVVKWPLYDPSIQSEADKPEGLPRECVIDDTKREWALRYIEERCLKWKAHLENLQWSTVDRVLSDLPAGDPITHRNLSIQMQNLTREFNGRGYPLLPGISEEYKQQERK